MFLELVRGLQLHKRFVRNRGFWWISYEASDYNTDFKWVKQWRRPRILIFLGGQGVPKIIADPRNMFSDVRRRVPVDKSFRKRSWSS